MVDHRTAEKPLQNKFVALKSGVGLNNPVFDKEDRVDGLFVIEHDGALFKTAGLEVEHKIKDDFPFNSL